jgi:tight adherence protein B
VTLLAALCSGVVAYLAVGALTGAGPAGRPSSHRRRRRDRAQLWLVQAGVQLTPRQFWASSVALGVAAFAAVVLLTATPSVAIVPAVAVTGLPRLVFARQRAQRLRAVQEAWPDALRELVAGITAGLSLSQALSGLAHTGPPAIRQAFARFPALLRTVGVIAALEVLKAELADPTTDRIVEVLILAHERGGRIVADILRDLAEATNEDLKTGEQITTDALEQKINARAVFVLPWLVLLLLTAQPGHFRDFYQSSAGLLVVAGAGGLSLVGIAVLGRLARDPVEERVLIPSAAREERP